MGLDAGVDSRVLKSMRHLPEYSKEECVLLPSGSPSRNNVEKVFYNREGMPIVEIAEIAHNSHENQGILKYILGISQGCLLVQENSNLEGKDPPIHADGIDTEYLASYRTVEKLV